MTNQVPPLPAHDVLASDTALAEAVERWVSPDDPDGAAALHDLGRLAGTAEVRAWADQADRVTPVLRTHAPTGERLDEVEYHPAYHRLMEVAVGEGLTAEPWTRPVGTGAHARRAAGFVRLVAGRGGPPVPGLDDVRRRPGAGGRPRPRRALAARARLPRLRPGAAAPRRQAGPHGRDGDDREAGWLRRAGQHHPCRGGARRPGRGRDLPAHRPQVVLLGPDERRVPRPGPGPTPASRASSSPASSTTGRATPSGSSGSRTSSATARTPPRRSSSTRRGPSGSATRDAGCAPSSTWSPPPGSTASSARPRRCARR